VHFLDTFLTVYQHFLTQYGTLFIDPGQKIFRSFSVVMLVWFGVMTAVNSSEFMGGFRWGSFIKLLLLIATCKYLLYNYTDFLNLIAGFSADIATKIQAQVDTNFFQHLVAMVDGIEKPNPFNIILSLIYVIMYAFTAILKAVVYYVIAFGFLAEGVIAMLGPFFVPFLIIPKLDFIFWGWLKSLIQYAFYPIVANAFVYVWSGFITSQDIYKHLSGSQLVSSGIPIIIICLVGIFSIFKVPTLVNHIFSGISGAGSSIIPFTGGK